MSVDLKVPSVRRQAFTLIELLVPVAVISILAALFVAGIIAVQE